MFSVITNIYKKKNQRTYLNGIVSNGIDSSLAAVLADFFGLCRKLARTRSTSSLADNGRSLDFSLHGHPAAEMWTTMKNKLTGEKQFLICSFHLYRFRKYVSYGFPIINFCIPGVHYETPCISVNFHSPILTLRILWSLNCCRVHRDTDRATRHVPGKERVKMG
jgi:hypothetical protein